MKMGTMEFISSLEGDSKQIITEFLNKTTSERSHRNYGSAIVQLFKKSNKKNVCDLSYEDYAPIAQKEMTGEKKTTQDFYKETFFKYLYANEIIVDNDKFEWSKEKLIRLFQSTQSNLEKDNTPKEDELDKRVLSTTEIFQIQEKLAQKHTNFETLKMELLWYILFETDCAATELKEVKSVHFKKPYIVTKNNKYLIPEKFSSVFETLSEKQYNGFYNLNDIIQKLGEIVGIKDLTPRAIQNTRKANTLTCSNCGTSYTNTVENWQSIKNRIICTTCANFIKKNLNLTKELINNVDLEVVSNTTPAPSVSNTFDELITKLPRNTDYLKIHEFQMRIGDLGEAFAYDHEMERLKMNKYRDLVDKSKASDPKNGYDILSYDEDGTELYIEVKTSVGSLEKDFYITSHELKTAEEFKLLNKKYLIYRISNILGGKANIKLEVISDILDSNKYVLEPSNYKVQKRIEFANATI